ncbi:MAG: MFS transporter [Myxococcota bacterium]
MERDRLLTAPFVLISVASFAQGLAFNLFLHLPGYLDGLGASEVQIGFIFGLASVAAIGVRPPIGRAMDVRGRRGVILFGGVLNVLVCGLYLGITEVGLSLYANRILHGLAQAMLFTAMFTYAADCVPARRRTEGLALFGVSGMLSMSLGGVLGDAILSRADYSVLFAAATGLALLSLVLSIPLRDRPRLDSPGDAEPHGFLAALGQRDLLPLWWIGAVFATALACLFSFLKLFVESSGLGSVGGFFSAYSGAAIVMRILLGWLPDRIGPKRVLFPSLAALSMGFVVLAYADRAQDVLLAGVLCGLGHGFTFPILFGLVVTRTREADRGSGLAIYTALFDLGIVVGAPSFGFVIGDAGFAAAFIGAAVLVAGGASVFAIWDRGR